MGYLDMPTWAADQEAAAVAEATADVEQQLVRADQKAATLLGLSGAALFATVSVLPYRPTLLQRAAGGLTLLAFGVACVLLAEATRPRVRTASRVRYGFARLATMSIEQIREDAKKGGPSAEAPCAAAVRRGEGRGTEVHADPLGGVLHRCRARFRCGDRTAVLERLTAMPQGSDGLDWRRYGLCVGSNPEQWFSDHPEEIAFAQTICGMCPVRVPCGAGARERGEDYGVWGGERREPRYLMVRRAREATNRAA